MVKKKFVRKFRRTGLKGLLCRSSTITNFLYKRYLFIHKGNLFNKILINKFQIGYKLGEFSFTRKPFNFTKKKKKLNFVKR